MFDNHILLHGLHDNKMSFYQIIAVSKCVYYIYSVVCVYLFSRFNRKTSDSLVVKHLLFCVTSNKI